jgi:hypothetical protein
VGTYLRVCSEYFHGNECGPRARLELRCLVAMISERSGVEIRTQVRLGNFPPPHVRSIIINYYEDWMIQYTARIWLDAPCDCDCDGA